MGIREAKIPSPERVTSQDEATALVLPLKANLVLLCRAFPSSKVRIALLLEPSGVLSLASRLRSLAFDALSLASRQRFLALGAVSESDAESATLLACKSAPILASRAMGLILPASVVDANDAAVASLLAESALALSSRDRRGLALRRAEIVL